MRVYREVVGGEGEIWGGEWRWIVWSERREGRKCLWVNGCDGGE